MLPFYLLVPPQQSHILYTLSRVEVLSCCYSSAGVGRTGAYIGLDIAFDQAINKAEVNIDTIVRNMRSERCLMVQTVVRAASSLESFLSILKTNVIMKFIEFL